MHSRFDWGSYLEPEVTSTRDSSMREIATETAQRIKGFVGTKGFYLPEFPEISHEAWNNSLEAQMSLVLIPGFTHSDVSVRDIVQGKQGSGLNNIYSREYLRGIAEGLFPLPDRNAYTMMVDAEGDTTALTEALGIESLKHTSFETLNEVIASQGSVVLEKLGYNADASIQVLTAEQLLLLRAARPQAINRMVMSSTPVGTSRPTYETKTILSRLESPEDALQRLSSDVSQRRYGAFSVLRNYVSVGRRITDVKSRETSDLFPRLAIVFSQPRQKVARTPFDMRK